MKLQIHYVKVPYTWSVLFHQTMMSVSVKFHLHNSPYSADEGGTLTCFRSQSTAEGVSDFPLGDSELGSEELRENGVYWKASFLRHCTSLKWEKSTIIGIFVL